MKHDESILQLIADIKATEKAIKDLRCDRSRKVKCQRRQDKRQLRLRELCA